MAWSLWLKRLCCNTTPCWPNLFICHYINLSWQNFTCLSLRLERADEAQRVAKTEPRDNLWQAQTPQMFRYGLLKEALTKSGAAPTDEAQAVEALGYKPKLVTGQLRNMKVTYPQDLAILEAIILANLK
ncbi:MAG: hypothetical protein EBU03_04805 [Methylophilaceae bacterium]|nr:hypothetical protein [Methylophilaceae bacterium]